MTEAPEGVTLTRFDSQHLELEKTLARKLARWAADSLKAIAACDPPLPKGVRNRVADNWRPLFQIAHVVGGHWPARITEAFYALTTAPPQVLTTNSSTIDHQLLLSDIRAIFNETGVDRLFTRDLLARLAALPDRPWKDLISSQLKPEQWLASQLRPLGIRPRSLWIGGTPGKGYLRDAFAT